MKARISEVFDSVQGEGLYFGERQIFVRFFGCNLNCHYCDTRLNKYFEYKPEELLEEIRLYHNIYHSISFTGGEPLLQNDFLKEILDLTKHYGYKNYLETNGTLTGELEDLLYYLDFIAMDIKLPSSTRMPDLWGLHKRFLKVAARKDVFLKAIICESTVDDDIKQMIDLIKEVNIGIPLVFQPNSADSCAGLYSKMERFRSLCQDNMITSCIIPQMHKVMGVR